MLDNANLPTKFKPLLDFSKPRYRFYVYRGGRGGAKSRSFATCLLLLGRKKKIRVFCAREIQKSIKKSVKQVLDDEIERLELKDFYFSTREEIRGANGTEFFFDGLKHNIDNIKSLEKVDICWIEEANVVSEDSFDKLIPSIRQDGSEIWISYNPDLPTDYIHQYFKNPREDALVVHVNYYDNPWFPAVLKKDMEFDRENFPLKYKKTWLGQPGASELQVIRPEWWHYYKNPSEIEKRISVKIITADTAYEKGDANDPSCFHCWGLEGGKRMYLLDRVSGKWHFPELLEMAKVFWAKHTEQNAAGSLVKARCFLVEDKASGKSLVQTLVKQGINAVEWSMKDYDIPNDKVSRAKETSFLVFGKKIWLPDYVEGKPSESLYPWVEDVVDQFTSFSEDMSHDHDDDVDCLTMAALFWQKMGGGQD